MIYAPAAQAQDSAAQAQDSAAHASSSSKAGERAQEDDREIVVTGSYTTGAELGSATGLGLTIRETPQSVTVMTAQRMEDQGIRTLSDVVNNAAGVSARSLDSSRNGFSARGFDINNYQIDGVPLQWENGYSAGETLLDIAMYDRIEIVRGATGLLTGAGEPSASINLIRKHADSVVPTGSLTASIGRWDAYSLAADFSTRVTSDGSVRARVIAKYGENDSYVDILHDEKLVLYGVVDADLGPDTALSFGASYQDNNPRGTLWGGLPTWYADGSRTDWDRSKTTGTDWSRWASQNENYFANLRQNIGENWTVELYGSYSANKGDLHLLYVSGQPDRETGLGLNRSAYRADFKRKQIDVGFKLNGTYQLLGRSHELVLGANYAKQDQDIFTYASSNVAEIGDFNAWDGSFPEPTWGERSRNGDVRTRQWGYFAATRLSIADPLKVILGGRLASWKRDGVLSGSPVDFGNENRFLPYAGVLYDVTPDHTLYASYTKIYNPQDARDREGEFLPPITGQNYEAGLKSAFFNGGLTTAISVFHIKQDNLAQPDTGYTVPGTNPPAEASYAANGARSTGFEVEANGEILPGWSLAANYTQFTAEDADDQRINTLYPQKLLRVFSTYDFAGTLEGLTIGGGVNWEDTSYTDTVNPVTKEAERLKIKSYALVNLMARYKLENGLSLQLNAENLFDKKYYSQIGFYNQLAFGEPRNVTLTARYEF
ncbi:TonB-dependent siderophore receptor [Altererythrobacter endophyticus]|uniref:TonB-dependent siderophore receptor n=2 Tax=Altericroceibacterium endophyticum TaxID=1808508 RepID=A0A6I4T2G9_9SPHN|nr:TonB-dependent siderophore receptor [Altericroceibacterium endophyticum]